MKTGKGLFILSPIAVFLLLYVALSVIAGDFYKVPVTVAFMLTCVYALATWTGITIKDRIKAFSQGAGAPGIMLMIWIFILAGAFASSASEMGCIDSTVNLTLKLLPPSLLLPGLFLAACVISLSIGTSVGTIVALVPIASGLASATGCSLPMITAAVVGGAFFGDNLSFISDTTIVATSTQGCKLSDKFRVNCFIAVPAAAVAFAIYAVMGSGMSAPAETGEVVWYKVLPYLAVLVMAVCGIDVMVVLASGLMITGIAGIASGSFDLFGWLGAMGKGISSMGELIVVTMLAGGLLETIRQRGGIDWLISKVLKLVKGKRSAELSIALLVCAVNVCTANNTVALVTVGGISRDISQRFGLDNRKTASIMDTFSCLTQGLLPYGAQMLMAASLAALSPAEIIPWLCYPYILGIVAVTAILIRYPRRYS